MTFKAISIALSLIAGAGAAHLASAQANSTPPQAQQPSAQVSDSDLALFLKASQRVAEVRQQYQRQLQQADSTDRAQELQQEATEMMRGAVESFGLTVDEFNQIASAAQADPTVRERLVEMGEG